MSFERVQEKSEESVGRFWTSLKMGLEAVLEEFE